MFTETEVRSAPRFRTVALLGPSRSGRTTLFEALMKAAEAPAYNKGAAIGHCKVNGQPWVVVDCAEFLALPQTDIAVVVCEPTAAGARAVAPLLADLQKRKVAHLLFTNKMDTIFGRIRDTVALLQEHSPRPLVLRQVPIRERGEILGHVDLISSKSCHSRKDEPPSLFAVPARPRSNQTEEDQCDDLADRDAGLDARILNDVRMSPDEVFRQLKRTRRNTDIVEVLLGSAMHGNGVERLWRSLRDTARLTDRRNKSRPGTAPRRLTAQSA